jgi:hypothetical protein
MASSTSSEGEISMMKSFGAGADAALHISGLPPSLSPTQLAVMRTRLHRWIKEMGPLQQPVDIRIHDGACAPREVGRVHGPDTRAYTQANTANPDPIEFVARQPRRFGGELVLPKETMKELDIALGQVEFEHVLFGKWDFDRLVDQCVVLILAGQSGTGKTRCAHHIAKRLNMPIIETSATALRAALVGEGPKNVVRAFHAARDQKALLFIDEAETLVGVRVDATHSSDTEQNTMCNATLMATETHRGVVVFATNHACRFDKAAQNRAWTIRFTAPDEAARQELWRTFIEATAMPMDADVVFSRLARLSDGLVGRQMRRAVVIAATIAARDAGRAVRLSDFEDAIEIIRRSERSTEAPAVVGSAAAASPVSLDQEALGRAIRAGRQSDRGGMHP